MSARRHCGENGVDHVLEAAMKTVSMAFSVFCAPSQHNHPDRLAVAATGFVGKSCRT
jgi:hypothetical protein